MTSTPPGIDCGEACTASVAELTEGGLVYGGGGQETKWPKYGFVIDLGTGELARIDPPPNEGVGVWVIGGNDRREALVSAAVNHRPWSVLMLWKAGAYTRVEDLAQLPWTDWSGDAINARGQLVVSGWDGKRRAVAILTPSR